MSLHKVISVKSSGWKLFGKRGKEAADPNLVVTGQGIVSPLRADKHGKWDDSWGDQDGFELYDNAEVALEDHTFLGKEAAQSPAQRPLPARPERQPSAPDQLDHEYTEVDADAIVRASATSPKPVASPPSFEQFRKEAASLDTSTPAIQPGQTRQGPGQPIYHLAGGEIGETPTDGAVGTDGAAGTDGVTAMETDSEDEGAAAAEPLKTALAKAHEAGARVGDIRDPHFAVTLRRHQRASQGGHFLSPDRPTVNPKTPGPRRTMSTRRTQDLSQISMGEVVETAGDPTARMHSLAATRSSRKRPPEQDAAALNASMASEIDSVFSNPADRSGVRGRKSSVTSTRSKRSRIQSTASAKPIQVNRTAFDQIIKSTEQIHGGALVHIAHLGGEARAPKGLVDMKTGLQTVLDTGDRLQDGGNSDTFSAFNAAVGVVIAIRAQYEIGLTAASETIGTRMKAKKHAPLRKSFATFRTEEVPKFFRNLAKLQAQLIV